MTTNLVQIKTANFEPLEKQITIKEAALRTIRMEAAAINQLAAQLDDQFEKAIDCLAACKGRVVISGIGKTFNANPEITDLAPER